MAAEAKQTCFEGRTLQNFQVYLEQSRDHEVSLWFVHNILPGEFKRYRKKGCLHILTISTTCSDSVEVVDVFFKSFCAV